MFPTFSDILADQPKSNQTLSQTFLEMSFANKSSFSGMKWASDGWMDQDDITLLPPTGECSENRCHDGDESTASGGQSDSGAGSQTTNEGDRDTSKADSLTQCPPQLPSVGSVPHESGQCKPCLFHPRGNCTNGENCNFCHFEHETRKNKKKGSEPSSDQNAKQPIPGAGPDSSTTEKSDSIACPTDALSLGSVAHPDACTECQFFFFSQSGCSKGQDCEFCHEFHPRTNEKKNRRLLRRLAGLASRSTNTDEEATKPKDNKSSTMTLANLLSPPPTPRTVNPSVQFAPTMMPDPYSAPLPYIPPMVAQQLSHSVPPVPMHPCPPPPVYLPALDQAATPAPAFEHVYARQPMCNQGTMQGPPGLGPRLLGVSGLHEPGNPPCTMPGQGPSQPPSGDESECMTYQSHFQQLLQMELQKKYGRVSAAPPMTVPPSGIVTGPPRAPPPGLVTRPPPGLDLY